MNAYNKYILKLKIKLDNLANEFNVLSKRNDIYIKYHIDDRHLFTRKTKLINIDENINQIHQNNVVLFLDLEDPNIINESIDIIDNYKERGIKSDKKDFIFKREIERKIKKLWMESHGNDGIYPEDKYKKNRYLDACNELKDK